MNSFYQLQRKALRVVLFVLLLWVIGVNNGRAERVSTKVAQSVAIAFFNNNGIKSSSVTDVSQEVGFSNLYVFNGESGFVILAADNRVKPILGYSLTGRFVAENMPDNLRWWLQGYNDEIQYAIDNRVVAPINTEKEWSDLERGLSNRTRISKVVEPLITSKWGQNSPYNLQCPEGTSTGCVATAMAQIMYKWRYPICGTGTHTSTGYPELSADFGATIYDWDNMIDTYDEFSTDVQKIAVSTLMLHCGISVDMQYGPQSAASTFDAMLALKNYFGYSMSAFYMSRDIVDDDEEWKTMIKDELDEGRPLQYRGDSDYSHSFVCDGYNNDDYFHFNWGWYGEPDTYFSLDGLVPSGYNFNSNQAAIFGIQPICYTVAVSANLIAGGSVSGSGTYYQNSQCTLTATPNAHYTFTNWTKDNVVVSTDPTYTFTVTEDGAYTANFAAVPQYTITATAVPTAGGTVSGAGTYYANSQCTLTATPNAHYDFTNWTKDNIVLSADPTYTFTVTEDGAYTANFTALDIHSITCNTVEHGSIYAHPTTAYEGETVTLTAYPYTTYGLSEWIVLDTNNNSIMVIHDQFTMPNQDVTVSAIFTKLQYVTVGILNYALNDYTMTAEVTGPKFSDISGQLNIPSSITYSNDRQINTYSVTSIGSSAFENCVGLTGSLTIPNSVTSIGFSAFKNCSGFTGPLTIPNSVTSIGSSAFENCVGLTGSLTIPNSVTSIGSYAFKNCSGFTGPLTIPNSVTLIGDCAFENCNGFMGPLTIGTSVTSIGRSAFANCSGLSGIDWNAKSVSDFEKDSYNYQFKNCNGITTLVFGNQVQNIPAYAFESYGSEGLNLSGTLTIPNSVITIGDHAFKGCSGFTGPLTIPNSVTTIGSSAFSGCSGFTGPLTIGTSVTSIHISAFERCRFSGSLSLPASITYIGPWAFWGCGGLEAVCYEGNLEQWCNISFGAYSGNPLHYAHNLYIDNELVTNLVIPETVTEIKDNTFEGCSGFTGYLTIPNSVTAIGNSAFDGCTGFIGTLTIGNSLESIGSYAFSNCSGLKGVRIHSLTPPTIAQSSLNFNGADRSVPVFVPCGTQNDYKAAQYWSDFENINESPYNLVITSNDELGGEISVLEYADCEDNHCAILAVPNIGYNFLGWYVDDYFATITPFCDFTLTEDVTFEARFEMLPNHNVANGTSNLWSDPGTWFLGEVPTSTSSVGIWKDVIVDVDAEVTAVGIYDGSTITVKPGVTLTVTDTLGSTENSSIMIQDGGQLVHSNGEAKATIQKSIEPYTSEDDGWNLISFPLVGNGDLTTIGNMLSNQYDLYAYDEPTEVWKNQKYESNDFTSLEAGVGYLYANKGTATDIVPVGEQIGEGTSTIGYTPFYTYYKYSIAENLFLASELLTAGLSTTPIGALYWYATNETGYVQSNISIWMANVDDAELTTTSHNVSEMTLVYTGNMTPVTGWNPFVFNENSFAWDGVSNLLVCVQRNNGAWNSPIYWRAHNPGFDAVSYKYTDDNAYDMATETYSMSVTLLRPDTFFQTTDQVGQQSANYLPITMSFAGELENGTAEVTVPLSYTEGIGLAGFNLVGNPFVHNVTSYTGTNVADGCFRLNDTRDNLIVSEISASNPLKPVEGFFVKATATEASITFNHQTRGEKTKRGVINMELSADGKIIDRLLVRNDGDPLEKLSLGHSKARLFVVEDRQEMAAVPMEGNEQPICFKTAKTGTYTITVNLEGMELNYLYLIDHMTGANVNLLVEPSYSFEARNSDYESRFQLLYSPKEASGADDEQFAFISNGSIIIMGEYSNATLQIVDMTGRLAYSLNGRIQCVPTEGMASGAYVLRLINGNKVRTQKIVIK